MTNLSKVKEININEIFKSNAEVRNWLIENQKELEEAIHTEFSTLCYPAGILEEARPDVYAEENMTYNKVEVLINLNETTDEDFKKFLAIAAGNNVKKAVWIVTGLDDKTRCILDWLNEKTEYKTQFIILKVSAYQIENSLPAINLVRI
jgi:hypothetical protein